MSDMWSAATGIAAARLGTVTRDPALAVFTPWAAVATPTPFVADRMVCPSNDAEPEPAIDTAALEADAFAQGFAEGRRTAEIELAEDRAALIRLAESLQALRAEPHHELGLLLAETVERLVRQIVGEVTIDSAAVLARANAAAALIAEESRPARMRLCPEDHARLADADLPVDLIADATLAPGTVLVETGEGWIEDGPEAGLEKLSAALDRMGVPR